MWKGAVLALYMLTRLVWPGTSKPKESSHKRNHMVRDLGNILGRTSHSLYLGKESILHNAALKMPILHLLCMVEPHPLQDTFLRLRGAG